MASKATSSTRSPLLTIVSPRCHDFTTSATPSAARLRACSVSTAENDELGTIRGWIRAAASAASGPVRSPANRPWIPSRIGASSVSRSSERSTVSRILAASARRASQRTASRASSVALSSVPRSPARVSARIAARSSGVTPSANAASIGATLRSSSRTCCAATEAPRAIVKSYWGSTASRAASRSRSVRTSLTYCAARGAATLEEAGMPSSSCVWAGRNVQAQDHRHGRDEQDGRQDQAARVAAGEVVRVLCGSGEHGHAPPTKEVSAPCRGRPGRAWRAPARRGRTPTLPSARPRIRGESQPMTLPRSRADVAPVSAMPWSTSALSSSSVSGCGRYSAEDGDLRLLLRGEVLAAALAERLDALATGLGLAHDHGEDLVVRERGLPGLLGVVDGVLDHPQRVATQRVTRPHRGGRVVLQSFAKGHRMAPRASRRRRCAPTWCRARELRRRWVPGRVPGRRFSGGPLGTAAGSPAVGGRRGARAQPWLARAFFLRFASFRFRFTDGFS